MNIKMRTIDYKGKYTVDLPTVSLVFIVSLSFLLHLFTVVFSGYAYAISLFAFTIIYVISRKRIIGRWNTFTASWFISVITLFLSFLHSQRSNGAFLDVIVFSCGFCLIVFCYENYNSYLSCLSVIKKIATFFAVGVLLQRFLPSLYRVVILFFPSAYRTYIISNDSSGFASNTGYSAGYIIAGLLVVISELSIQKYAWRKSIILLMILLIGLFLTQKRGPILFLILTAMYCYLAPVKGYEKLKRYWRLFSFVLIAVIIIWAFRDTLSSVSFVGKILDSIAGAIDGKDITSGRTRLYIWAIELFKRNPIVGIGWGRYRTTVVGNVTLFSELEAHNIYFQLLAETGIIGFIVFVTTFIIFWNSTRIALCDIVQRNSSLETEWRNLLYFSFAYQTYFLLYGLTGNPLYDPHFQLMYIFSCMIMTGYSFSKALQNV